MIHTQSLAASFFRSSSKSPSRISHIRPELAQGTLDSPEMYGATSLSTPAAARWLVAAFNTKSANSDIKPAPN